MSAAMRTAKARADEHLALDDLHILFGIVAVTKGRGDAAQLAAEMDAPSGVQKILKSAVNGTTTSNVGVTVFGSPLGALLLAQLRNNGAFDASPQARSVCRTR